MKTTFYEFLNEHKLHKNIYQLLDYIEKLSEDKFFVIVLPLTFPFASELTSV